jgi:hypothetical protein
MGSGSNLSFCTFFVSWIMMSGPRHHVDTMALGMRASAIDCRTRG